MLSIEALIWKCDIGTTTTFLVRVPSEEDSVTSPDSGSNQVPLLVNCVNTLPVTHALARDKTTGSFTSVMLKVNVSSKDNSFWSVVVSCGAFLISVSAVTQVKDKASYVYFAGCGNCLCQVMSCRPIA